MREIGFGDLQRRIVLQIVLAVAGMDFTRPSYDGIGSRDSYERLRPAVVQASLAMQKSVRFLSDDIGLKTNRLLPYASIIVMLAIYFHESSLIENVVVKSANRETLIKWFWATSFNGWFAGANTTDLRRAGETMRSLARGRQTVSAFFSSFLGRPIRAFPETYDRRSARVRASLLVQTIVGKPRNPRTHKPIDVSAVFNDAAARDIPYFFPNQRRPAVSNPANRVILPEGFPRSAKQEFLALSPGPAADLTLRSHFISPNALQALRSDDFEAFISAREHNILEAEQVFLVALRLGIDQAAERSSEEVDAEE